MITVVLADDHPVVQTGMVALLSQSEGIELVGVASDGLEAVRLAKQHKPNLVLMDLRMPGLNGVEATRQILATQPDTRVLVLTTYEADEDIIAAVEAGAMGYLLKAAPAAEIIDGIRAVAQGQSCLAPAAAAALVRHAQEPPPPSLTDREGDVLALVALGLSNQEVAQRLYLQPTTIKTHLDHIFSKLNVADRTRAVTKAIELGIISSPKKS